MQYSVPNIDENAIVGIAGTEICGFSKILYRIVQRDLIRIAENRCSAVAPFDAGMKC